MQGQEMSIRRPVVALTTLLFLAGCGSGIKSCVQVLDTPGVIKPPKVATKTLHSKPVESSPPPTGDDLGAAAAPHGPLRDAGQKLAEDAAKGLIEDAAKPRDQDKKRDNDRRNY